MYTEDECKINGLQLMELEWHRVGGGDASMLDISYALTQVDPQTKETKYTHGKVTANGGSLSTPTWEAFKQLIIQIEQDLAPRHFKQEAKEKQDETRVATRSEEVDQI